MLIERDTALRSLADRADDAAGGEGQLVFVAGEAGIGKSALLERFAADRPQLRWSWGACDGLFTPRPLGPLFDIAGQLGGELAERCRDGADRETLFAALRARLDEPDVLDVVVVEDVHWADEATLDLVRFLGRRLRGARALLLVTYRDDGVPDPLRRVLGELAGTRAVHRIDLEPLSVTAVRDLAGDSGLDGDELFRITAGNPFYVTETVQAGLFGVPSTARDAVLARAGRLDPAAREVVSAAALIGSSVDLRVLDLVTAASAATIDDVLGSGLLVTDGPDLRFRHEIARRAVEGGVPAHRCRDVHARILAALRQLGVDDDAALAYHAEGAGDADAVLRHAPAAARQAAALSSRREAIAQYDRALRFATTAPPTTVAECYDGLAEQKNLLDRPAEAEHANLRALDLWRSVGDRRREGDTLRRLAVVSSNLCRGAAALDYARSAVETLEPLGPTRELAWAYARLAAALMCNAEHAAATALARRAQALAAELDDDWVRADSMITEGCSLTGDEGAPAAISRGLELALDKGLPALVARGYNNLLSAYGDLHRYTDPDAERCFRDGLAFCVDHDLGDFEVCLWSCWALILLQLGRWDEVMAACEPMLDRETAPLNRVCLLNRVGTVRARRGATGVWELLDEAMGSADGSGEPQYVLHVRLARVEACWLADDQVAAAAELRAAGDGYDAWTRGLIAVWDRRLGGSSAVEDMAEPYAAEIAGDHRRAADLWLTQSCPYEAAMALLGSDDEALLREALSLVDGLGAVATGRVVRRRMRSVGIRSVPAGARTATRAHPLGLTRREHEILELLCTGLTNNEIATTLVVSPKTVDHHVSSVLTKLGARTRRAAADKAVELGVVGADAKVV